jgi:hypothetical protein
MFEHIIAKSQDSSGFVKNQNSGSNYSKPESDFYSMILNHNDNSLNKEVRPEPLKPEEQREEYRNKTETGENHRSDNNRTSESIRENESKASVNNEIKKNIEEHKDGKAEELEGSEKKEVLVSTDSKVSEETLLEEETLQEIGELLKSNPEITALSQEQIVGIIESVINLEKIKGNPDFSKAEKPEKGLSDKPAGLLPENLKKIPEKIIEEFLSNNKGKESAKSLKEDDIRKIAAKLILESAEGKKESLSPRERNFQRMVSRDDVKPENQIVNGEKVKQAVVEDEGSTGKKSFSDKGDSKEGFNFSFQKQDFSGKRVSETPDIKGKTPEFRQNLQEIIDKARITVRDSRNGNFIVKLYPREMGNVNVNLILDNGTITARFVVDSDEAKNLLSQNLDNLRQQLKDAGIEVGEFFVNVNDHGKRFFQENNQDRKKDLLLFPEGKEAGMAAIEYDGNTHVLNSSSINVVI